MPTRNINGVDLGYLERGQGPTLVLVHGFPLDARIWDDQLADLSNAYRVIAPDLRGFGQSKSDKTFTMESLAADLNGLLKAIDALPCVLGGLSMGGYVALAYAKKYRSSLRAVVLIDTKAEADTVEAKEGRLKMVELARASGAKAVADQMMPKMLAPETADRRPDVAKRLRAIMEACPAKTIEHALLAMRDRPDRTEELAWIDVPVLLLVGASDAITPVAQAEAMRKQLSNPTLEVIADAGHMTPMEQPDQVNAALRQFMESIG